MIRRITFVILLVTWATLVLAGVATYLATRHVLLSDLDASVVANAMALPEVVGVQRTLGSVSLPAGDRYLIRNDAGRTLARPTATRGASPNPTIVARTFTRLADGRRFRSLTLRIPVVASAQRAAGSLLVTYSTPAEAFDRLLSRLVLWLAGTGLVCGVISAAVARRLSQLALLPLTRTAEAIQQINEARLDQRLDSSTLPPELHVMARRLNELLARLDRAFAQRRRFLADTSHELRTPVAALLTTLEVAMRRPRDGAEMSNVMNRCLQEAKDLRRLVEALTRQVQSDSTSWDEPAEVFELQPFVASCVQSVQNAFGSGQQIDQQVPQSLTVRTQRGRLRSVIINLLSNAVEYGGTSGTVSVRAVSRGDQLVIDVEDAGPGIAPEQLPSLFEPFFRGELSSARSQAHLGLGLSIVRAHVQALGGSCTVKSEPGKGTLLTVTLPAAIAAQNRELQEQYSP